MFRAFLHFTLLSVLTGCSLHTVGEYEIIPDRLPTSFVTPAGEAEPVSRWWREFNDPYLQEFMIEALAKNLTITQAWARLEQAREGAVVARSALYPQANATLGGQQLKRKSDSSSSDNPGFFPGPGGGAGGGGGGGGVFGAGSIDEFYIATPSLTYELDLWAKVRSRAKAGSLREEASEEAVLSTLLATSGRVAEEWYTILEQRELIRLVKQQIESLEKQLELVELRLAYGDGSGLSVLQQRQQLASVRAELPVFRRSLALACNRFAILLGRSPGQCPTVIEEGEFPPLPPLPEVATPQLLLASRPDLRAAWNELYAADYEVAEALAERLPQINLSLSYQFTSTALKSLFDEQLRIISENILLPLIDGGSRRAVVRQRDARVQELLASYREQALVAMQEVEDALQEEEQQIELVKRVSKQIDASRATVDLSRLRYVNGQASFLDVVVALETLQRSERRLVTEKKELLLVRGRLYRALGGGGWFRDLSSDAKEV